MTKGWTEERRKAQAERCRRNKPWKNATGPRTGEGKARCKMNAYRHGMRCADMRELIKLLRLQRDYIKEVNARIKSGHPDPLPSNFLQTE